MNKTKLKYFCFGTAFGIIGTVVLLIGLSVLYSRQLINSYSADYLPAPRFIGIRNVDYASLGLKDLSGAFVSTELLKGKVVFINLWATWCAPCIIELPALVKLYSKIKGNPDIVMMFVSEEDQEPVNRFLQDNGFPRNLFYLSKDASRVLKNEGLPHTYIMDKEGRVVYDDSGAIKWDDKRAADFLNELSKE